MSGRYTHEQYCETWTAFQWLMLVFLLSVSGMLIIMSDQRWKAHHACTLWRMATNKAVRTVGSPILRDPAIRENGIPGTTLSRNIRTIYTSKFNPNGPYISRQSGTYNKGTSVFCAPILRTLDCKGPVPTQIKDIAIEGTSNPEHTFTSTGDHHSK